MHEPKARHYSIVTGILLLAAASAARAQAPLTADSVKSILKDVATVAHQNDSLTRVAAALQEKAQLLIADFAEHNKEPCEYPQGHPELCADFDAERSLLNSRSSDLQKELKANDTARRAAASQFAVLMAHLRTATYAPSLARQKAQLVACATLDVVRDAAACLARTQPAARRTPP